MNIYLCMYVYGRHLRICMKMSVALSPAPPAHLTAIQFAYQISLLYVVARKLCPWGKKNWATVTCK